MYVYIYIYIYFHCVFVYNVCGEKGRETEREP